MTPSYMQSANQLANDTLLLLLLYVNFGSRSTPSSPLPPFLPSLMTQQQAQALPLGGRLGQGQIAAPLSA